MESNGITFNKDVSYRETLDTLTCVNVCVNRKDSLSEYNTKIR